MASRAQRRDIRQADPSGRTARFVEMDGHDEEKRLRIVNRAAQAFLSHGYEGANLEDIANAAGISKVTIYRHFADKLDLFETVITETARDFGQALAGLLTRDTPVANTLERFARTFIERMMSPVHSGHPYCHLARVLLSATVRNPKIGYSCRWIFADLISAPLAAYFSEKIAAGDLGEGDPEFLASHFVQSLFFTNAVAMDPSLLPEPGEIAGLARRKVQLFLHGAAHPG